MVLTDNGSDERDPVKSSEIMQTKYVIKVQVQKTQVSEESSEVVVVESSSEDECLECAPVMTLVKVGVTGEIIFEFDKSMSIPDFE